VLIRGGTKQQQSMLALLIEERIPSDHLLRRIKKMADQGPLGFSREFDQMYSNLGHPIGGAPC
jgi:hypothetical protein